MTYWFLFFKSFHVIAVISWMAGLLYIFRLYVYHSAETEEAVMSRFRVMERRLWLAITVPAAWAASLTGLMMIVLEPCVLLSQGWISIKLGLAVGLIVVHFMAGHYRRGFFEAPFPLSEKAFRFMNEVPTLLMIAIVALVIFKPYWWMWPREWLQFVCG